MLRGRAGRDRDRGPGAGRDVADTTGAGDAFNAGLVLRARPRGRLARCAGQRHAVRDHDHLPTVRRPIQDRGDRMKLAVIGAGSTYTPELVSGLMRERERVGVDELVLHDIDASRLDVVGGLSRRILEAPGFRGRARAHRRARPGARRRRRGPDPDSRRRPGGAAARRDDPGGLRLRRPGDDRRRRTREGDADRAGRARDRGARARARLRRRLDHRLHESGRDRHARIARRRSPRDRPVQRRDQLSASDRCASRRAPGAGAGRAGRSQPPHVDPGGVGRRSRRPAGRDRRVRRCAGPRDRAAAFPDRGAGGDPVVLPALLLRRARGRPGAEDDHAARSERGGDRTRACSISTAIRGWPRSRRCSISAGARTTAKPPLRSSDRCSADSGDVQVVDVRNGGDARRSGRRRRGRGAGADRKRRRRARGSEAAGARAARPGPARRGLRAARGLRRGARGPRGRAPRAAGTSARPRVPLGFHADRAHGLGSSEVRPSLSGTRS